MTGALLTWLGGHPLAAVVFAYSILGGLGTLLAAGVTGLRMRSL